MADKQAEKGGIRSLSETTETDTAQDNEAFAEHTGGGWYEVHSRTGETERVQGKEAADARVAELNADAEQEDGDENEEEVPEPSKEPTEEAKGPGDSDDADPQGATGDEEDAADTGISGKANTAGGGDQVTGVTSDGVTNRSNDGTTGTPNRDEPNTMEGPGRPQGRAGSNTKAQREGEIAERATAVIQSYAKDDAPLSGDIFGSMMNIHDDLGVARADVIALANDLNREFGTTIDASEAQNFLLVRDVYNTVYHKLHG